MEKLPQCWERLRAGEGGADDEMVGWHCRLKGCEFEQTPETVKDREAWCAAALVVWSNEQNKKKPWVSLLLPPHGVSWKTMSKFLQNVLVRFALFVFYNSKILFRKSLLLSAQCLSHAGLSATP